MILKLKENTEHHENILAAFRTMTEVPDLNPFSFDYTKEDDEIFDHLSEVYIEVQSILKDADLPVTDLLVLKWDDGQDGHAITLGKEVYTFINLTAYSKHLECKGFDSVAHLLHEMVHGAHYSLNLEFCPLVTYKSADPVLFHSVIEGIATYVSNVLNPQGDNYWFGFLQNDDFQQWLKNCKKCFQEDISAFQYKEYSDEQKVNLISVKSMEPDDLVRGRRSYYTISTMWDVMKLDIHKLLTMDYEDLVLIISK